MSMRKIVECRDVCKTYLQGKIEIPALKNVNFTVCEGDYTAIIGPSGSGKSTLMNIIGCLDVPTSGTYNLEGNDIGRCSDNKLAELRNRYIGFVFQSFHLMPRMTALDNVALPLLFAGIKKRERRRMAADALRIVGLEDRMTHHPDQLSGGQNQRVAIARAIVGNPKLLLADEPTGALDSTSGKQVMELFEQLHMSGSTIIMITHDANIASHAKTIYHIFDGELSGAEENEKETDAGEYEDAGAGEEADGYDEDVEDDETEGYDDDDYDDDDYDDDEDWET